MFRPRSVPHAVAATREGDATVLSEIPALRLQVLLGDGARHHLAGALLLPTGGHERRRARHQLHRHGPREVRAG